MSDNPYVSIIHRTLPRLLAQVNQDKTDLYYGCGDRQFWAWKLIDFPNGTFQGAVHGLALMVKHDLLPDGMSKAKIIDLILSMIAVLPQLTDRHGGLAEALPNESSFCVTGLVLGDVLAALDILGDDLDPDDKDNIVTICTPMAHYLYKRDEVHGLISNHLATNALAMMRWYHLSGEEKALQRVQLWLDRIQSNGHLDEGWMAEYGHADPGYQSWCLSALVQLYELDGEGQLDCDQWIKKSYAFLNYFAMPDGSFGNGMGGRLTRFLFPGGLELAAKNGFPVEPLRDFARQHAPHQHFVTLESIDPSNMVPFFNDMVLAAVHYHASQKSVHTSLPCYALSPGDTLHFEQAGLLLHQSDTHYSCISIVAGGRLLRVSHDGNERVCRSQYVGQSDKKLYATQNGRVMRLAGDDLFIRADIGAVSRPKPSAFSFLVLRVLSLSVFQFPALGDAVKKILARLLVNPQRKPAGKLVRHIQLSTGMIKDEIKDISLKTIADSDGFSPTHMASQAYWQKGDTQ